MIQSFGTDGFCNHPVADSQFYGAALAPGKYGVAIYGEHRSPSKIDAAAIQVRAELTNALFSAS